VGAGTANSDPGVGSVALAATWPVGMEARWHVSQLVPVGMCALPAPAGVVGGMTMIFVTPAKLVPVTVGP
jgi:hypothetical protein